MIEEFSSGYYRARMTVQPLDRGPTIEKGLYSLINDQIYQQTDVPIMMRLTLDEGPTFTPSIEGAMPTDVIGVPTDLLDEMKIHPSSEDVNVFILKPKYAYMYQEPDISSTEGTQ